MRLRIGFGLVALLGVGLLFRSQWVLESGSADASGHYTDHLRHMGEALILTDQGLALYRTAYGELIAREGLGDEHSVLFPLRTAPYPPLGVLTHWPWAQLERTRVLEPVTTHRAVVWMWTLVALAACAVVLRLFAPLPGIAQLWAAGLAIPLLVGMGVNGFYDCGYLLFGAAACWAWRQQRPVSALWCLGMSAALHFRAAVFAPLAAVLVWELWRARRKLGAGLASAVLVIPSVVAAFTLTGSLETIPADNPVHYTHLKLALLLLALLTAGVTGWFWRLNERLVAATVVATFALALMERSHGWWHAGTLLAPGLILAARPHRVGWAWPVLLLWTVVSSYLAFRHPWSVFWQWVPFGLGGVH
jgi:hypothetical protein